MRRLKELAAVIAAVFLGLILPATAQMSFELGFGWTFVAPAFNSTYVNEFAPPLTPETYYVSSAAVQTLKLNGKASYGMSGFFNWFLNKNVGLQVLADYHRPRFSGDNSPYEVTLNYQIFDPETYHNIDNEWPDTSGDFKATTFSLNVIARFRVAPNLSLSFSAGPSLFHIQGKAAPIGFTSFRVDFDGEIYTLTGKTYKMVYEFGPDSRYGFNAGTEAAVTVFRNVILAVDIRWFQSSKSTCDLKIVPSDVITEPIEEIEETINLGSMKVDPSYFRAGLVIRFLF